MKGEQKEIAFLPLVETGIVEEREIRTKLEKLSFLVSPPMEITPVAKVEGKTGFLSDAFCYSLLCGSVLFFLSFFQMPKSELDTLSLSHPPLKNTQDIYRYIDSNEKNFSIDRYKDIVNFQGLFSERIFYFIIQFHLPLYIGYIIYIFPRSDIHRSYLPETEIILM